jgi:hypothetical protein
MQLLRFVLCLMIGRPFLVVSGQLPTQGLCQLPRQEAASGDNREPERRSCRPHVRCPFRDHSCSDCWDVKVLVEPGSDD